MSTELERTRRYEVSDFPPGTKMMIADRTDLDAAIKAGEIKAVGKFQTLSGGRTGVPAVYLSKRATPWHKRRGPVIGAFLAGAVVFLAIVVTVAILSIGLWGFVALVFVIAAGLIMLNRMASGGGRHRAVTVRTTTEVRVK